MRNRGIRRRFIAPLEVISTRGRAGADTGGRAPAGRGGRHRRDHKPLCTPRCNESPGKLIETGRAGGRAGHGLVIRTSEDDWTGCGDQRDRSAAAADAAMPCSDGMAEPDSRLGLPNSLHGIDELNINNPAAKLTTEADVEPDVIFFTRGPTQYGGR